MSLSGVTVAASVVIMDWLNIEDGLRCLEDEKTDFLHFDIMDGYFVADFTMGSIVVESIRQGSSIAAEFHAMVEEPRRIFSCFTPRKAEVFTIHYEASRNLHRDIVTLRKLGFRPGVVLNPQTPSQIEVDDPFTLWGELPDFPIVDPGPSRPFPTLPTPFTK